MISFANTSAYSPRECYSGVAEFSVYTASEARGRRAGTLAMEALIFAAERAGFWKLTSRVFVENEPSRKLLLSLGFREVGVHEKHARLDGLWRDVVVARVLHGDKARAERYEQPDDVTLPGDTHIAEPGRDKTQTALAEAGDDDAPTARSSKR